MKFKQPEKPQLAKKKKKVSSNYPCAPKTGLLNLPCEMTMHIFSYLSEHEIFWNIGFTCQLLRDMALDTVKIIDLCDSKIDIAKKHFSELLRNENIVQSIRHIWICSDLDEDVREALKQVLKDSREKYNILVIDYRLFNNFTSGQIGRKFTQLESLLMPKRHRSMKRLTNRSVRNIISSCKKLEWIDLRDCTEFDYFSNRNLVSLIGENCVYLECLLLSRCSFTNTSIQMVFKNCNNIEMVIMNDCAQLNDESLITLSEYCYFLKLLCVDNCKNISDKSIGSIARNCYGMEELSVRNTGVTDVSIKAIAHCCLELRVLNLRNCNVTDDAIEAISSVESSKLENLDITKISGVVSLECLRKIAFNCSNLKRLHIGFRSIWHNLARTIEHRLFTLSWSFASHDRVENCPHCYPIVKKEAPVIAKEIGLELEQLCLEGFVVNKNDTVYHCWGHN